MKKKQRGAGKKVCFILLIVLLGVCVVFVAKRQIERMYASKYLSSVQVEVLNGSDLPEKARMVCLWLRRKGVDVMDYGNAPAVVEHTVLIDRWSEDMRYAKALASLLRCKFITAEIDSTLGINVSLIIGKDYPKVFPVKEIEGR